MFRRILRGCFWVIHGCAVGFLLVIGVQYVLSNPAVYRPEPANSQPVETENNASKPALPAVDEFHMVKAEESRQENKPSPDESREKPEVKKVSETTVTNQLTNLPLTLKGTLTGGNPYEYAIVQNNNKNKTKSLREGEKWDELQLLAIHEYYVEINNLSKDRRELLYLPAHEHKHQKKQTNQPSEDQAESSAGEDSSKPEPAQDVQKVSRYQINKKIQFNMNNLLAKVKVTPALKNGKIIGFELQEFKGNPGELASRLGFKQGDIISRVNGTKLNSIEQATNLWSQMKNQSNFRITIRRDGTTHNFQYKLVE